MKNKVEDESADEMDEDASEEADKPKKQKEVELEEMKIEDKVQLINPNSPEYNIMILHQAGARWYRKEVASSLKKLMPIFEEIEPDEVSVQAEIVANKLEEKWLELYNLPIFEFDMN